MNLISPKSDIGFKKLISNETVRRYFISDVLGISPEDIKSIRLKNPFLRKLHKLQKQGILDALLELNDEKVRRTCRWLKPIARE